MQNHDPWKDPSPWIPMRDPIDLKHLGKLQEELGELQKALARCLIQGINEVEPTTKYPNIDWLTDEVADVLANIELVIERFALDEEVIKIRKDRKKRHLRLWHAMADKKPLASVDKAV